MHSSVSMIRFYFYDPGLYLLPLTDWEAGKRLNLLYLNQNGRLVQLVARQERNIGCAHVQTPANPKAIQIAACVVGWVRREQKYHGACKLLTKAGDNVQPGNGETDSKSTKIHRVGLGLPVVTRRLTEESGFSSLRIRKIRCRGIHMEPVGILIYRPATWDEVFTYKRTHTLDSSLVIGWEDFSRLNRATI